MNSYLPYKSIIKSAIVSIAFMSSCLVAYSNEEFHIDSLELEFNESLHEIDTSFEMKIITSDEKEINNAESPLPSDCSFGFDMLDNGFPYEGEIFKDIANEIDFSNVKSCLSRDTKYRAVVKVLIDSTGNLAVSNILISSGFKQTDVEALRVVNSLNKWTIPIQNGKPISVSISIPVLFKLEE
jgi:TonB family protein